MSFLSVSIPEWSLGSCWMGSWPQSAGDTGSISSNCPLHSYEFFLYICTVQATTCSNINTTSYTALQIKLITSLVLFSYYVFQKLCILTLTFTEHHERVWIVTKVPQFCETWLSCLKTVKQYSRYLAYLLRCESLSIHEIKYLLQFWNMNS